MAITKRKQRQVRAVGTTLAASTVYPLYDNPQLLITDGGEDFAAAAVGASPLSYNGEDMHHRVIVHTHTASGADNYVAVWVSTEDDAGHFVEAARYDAGSNNDAVIVTGSIDQAPYKYVALEVVGAVVSVDIESWGTHVR
jgi:hypothetical protein